ncbi:MAG: hypothetical protein C0599_02445, partial [Salinivirgaceae bacterium]
MSSTQLDIPFLDSFQAFLQIEKGLSKNTINAYTDDLSKLYQFLNESSSPAQPETITTKKLQGFLQWIYEIGLGPTSQARILSGIKAYFKYLK